MTRRVRRPNLRVDVYGVEPNQHGAMFASINRRLDEEARRAEGFVPRTELDLDALEREPPRRSWRQMVKEWIARMTGRMK